MHYTYIHTYTNFTCIAQVVFWLRQTECAKVDDLNQGCPTYGSWATSAHFGFLNGSFQYMLFGANSMHSIHACTMYIKCMYSSSYWVPALYCSDWLHVSTIRTLKCLADFIKQDQPNGIPYWVMVWHVSWQFWGHIKLFKMQSDKHAVSSNTGAIPDILCM